MWVDRFKELPQHSGIFSVYTPDGVIMAWYNARKYIFIDMSTAKPVYVMKWLK